MPCDGITTNSTQYNPPSDLQREIIAMSRYVLDDKNNHEDKLFNAAFCYSLNTNTHYYNFYSLLNTTSPHASPITQNTFDVALLRSIRDNKDYDIRVNNHPLRK